MLRHFVSPSHDDWDLSLPCCECAISNTWNQSTGNTPFFLNNGEHPRLPINVNKVCKLPAADTIVGRIKTAIASAKDFLRYAQQRMSDAYNAKHHDEAFQVGVAFLSPKGLFLSAAGSKKIMAKQLGPFEITAKVGRLAYQLLLPASMSRVQPVFMFLCLDVLRMVVAMLHLLLPCYLTASRNVKLTRFCSTDLGLTRASPTTKSTLCLGRVWGLRNVAL